jgi:AhpD family alkylhydroperoxidase
MEQFEPSNSIEAALHEFKQGLGTFTEKMPKIAKHFNEFSKACFEDGKLSKKHKQLIALANSVITQDEYCIIYHTKGCLDEGCSEEEILEAIGVSAAFGGGAALSQAVTLVLEAIETLNQSNQ